MKNTRKMKKADILVPFVSGAGANRNPLGEIELRRILRKKKFMVGISCDFNYSKFNDLQTTSLEVTRPTDASLPL
jgi:hypothetical protein